MKIAQEDSWSTQVDRTTWWKADKAADEVCDSQGCGWAFADESKCAAEAVGVRERWEMVMRKYRSSFTSEVEALGSYKQAVQANGVGAESWFSQYLTYDSSLPITLTPDSNNEFNAASLTLQQVLFRSDASPSDASWSPPSETLWKIYFGKSQFIEALTAEANFWVTEPSDWFTAMNEYRCRHVRRAAVWNYGLAASVQRYVNQRNFLIDSQSEDSPHPDGPAYELRYRSDYPIPPFTVLSRLMSDEEQVSRKLASPLSIASIMQTTRRIKEPYVPDPLAVWTAITWHAVRQMGCATSFDGKYHACRLWVGPTIGHPERVNNPDDASFSRNVFFGFDSSSDASGCFAEAKEQWTIWLKFIDLSVGMFDCIEEAWKCWVAARDAGNGFTAWCRKNYDFTGSECEVLKGMIGGKSGSIERPPFMSVLDDGLWDYPATPPPPANKVWIEAFQRDAKRDNRMKTLGAPGQAVMDNDDDESAAYPAFALSSLIVTMVVAISVVISGAGYL